MAGLEAELSQDVKQLIIKAVSGLPKDFRLQKCFSCRLNTCTQMGDNNVARTGKPIGQESLVKNLSNCL